MYANDRRTEDLRHPNELKASAGHIVDKVGALNFDILYR